MNGMRQPIGVFDSGIGGLTVVKAVMEELPSESIIYFGDTARVPYGTKSKSTIVKFSLENVEFLLRFGVKCIVIACNTSSSWALPTLRKYFKVPIIGVIRPGALAAVQATRTKRIGVIGTKATIHSGAYEAAIHRFDPTIKVFSESCPLFVPLVEEGWLNGSICKEIATKYLESLKRQRIDTLILGCTHYPLLTSTIQHVLGPDVTLVDSAKQTAVEVRGVLMGAETLCDHRLRPRYRFFVTDEPAHFNQVGHRFLGQVLGSVERVNGHH
ncbi:MAG: glutamate racemase [Candidatus Omnitrophica bacterium CG11_big_fil_rev_8_21_14_0_20_63_9]|nr:MAG: glutamate racemase [Candidatus Omnitrophica bacterium CG11_big_fil_rev_8_21_14_0_20_63_9]